MCFVVVVWFGMVSLVLFVTVMVLVLLIGTVDGSGVVDDVSDVVDVA